MALMVEVIGGLTVDKFLLSASFVSATCVHWNNRHMCSVCHLEQTLEIEVLTGLKSIRLYDRIIKTFYLLQKTKWTISSSND